MFQTLNNEKITLTQYLSMTKNIFTNNFNSILFIAVLILLPNTIINFFFLQQIYPELDPLYNYLMNSEFVDATIVQQYMDSIMPKLLIFSLINVFFASIIKGGIVYITNCAVYDIAIEKSEIIKNSIGNIIRLFFSRLVYILIISITLPTIIIPIYLGIHMIFHAEENVLENRRTFSALRNSIKLIRNKKGRALEVMFLIIIFYTLTYLVMILSNYVLPAFNIYGVVGIILGNFILSTLLLFFNIPITLKYINIKKIDNNL